MTGLSNLQNGAGIPADPAHPSVSAGSAGAATKKVKTLKTIPNLTYIVRESLLGKTGDMSITFGPATGHQVRAELWTPGATSSVTSLPTQRRVQTWITGLRQEGLRIVNLQADIPMAWERDLIEDLPVSDVTDLVDYLAEVAFDPTGMRNRPLVQMLLSPGDDGIDSVFPDAAFAAALDGDIEPLLDAGDACHTWLFDNREWLMQHTSVLEALVLVPNPRLDRGLNQMR